NAVWSGNQAGFLANPGNGKYAYIIDTGIAPTTGDLNVDMANGYNWVSTSTPAADDNGHGTHVAGTIGALANGYGVVGVAAGASVVPLKVLDASGSGSLTNVISAINYVLSNLSQRGISKASAVVNLSLGSATTWTSLDTAIINAANQGLRFAIAAGNSGRDVDGFTPARTGNNANVYTVSAVDSAYKMASWSNWDKLTTLDKIDNIDYAAPGVNVLSLSNQTGYLATMSGTSMASPHLAGLLLVGGITSGGLVTPYLSGTADPFALHA
ncbi:MAG: S8 family serine peptidase, partial [Cyanobacteria bacterium REEB498]|nr:S8 family serine peptidase [Cyanobacteria bacterium REEB498]